MFAPSNFVPSFVQGESPGQTENTQQSLTGATAELLTGFLKLASGIFMNKLREKAAASLSKGDLTDQGPVVQSPISTNPGLIANKTHEANPRLALIGL